MFNKYMYRDPDFIARYKLFGGVEVEDRKSGIKYTASNYERRHLVRGLEFLVSREKLLEQGEPAFDTLMRQFCRAIIDNQGPKWMYHFMFTTPEKVAKMAMYPWIQDSRAKQA